MSIALLRLQVTSFQNPNMWEFYIQDAPTEMKFYVVDTSLPLRRFEMETKRSGMKYYTSFTPEADFSITFRETIDFDVYNYFKEWKDAIYDPITKKFKVGRDVPRHKTAILAFEKTLNPIQTAYNKTFQFNGLQLKGMQDLSLSYNTQDSLNIVVDFSVDEVVPADNSTIPFGASLGNFLGSGLI